MRRERKLTLTVCLPYARHLPGILHLLIYFPQWPYRTGKYCFTHSTDRETESMKYFFKVSYQVTKKAGGLKSQSVLCSPG